MAVMNTCRKCLECMCCILPICKGAAAKEACSTNIKTTKNKSMWYNMAVKKNIINRLHLMNINNKLFYTFVPTSTDSVIQCYTKLFKSDKSIYEKTEIYQSTILPMKYC